MLWTIWVTGRNFRCSSHPLIHGIGRRGVGDGSRFPFLFFPLLTSLGAATLSWDKPGRRAKGSLQRAATARTADRKTGQNVPRHDLHRSNASMIKQKKTSGKLGALFILELWRKAGF